MKRTGVVLVAAGDFSRMKEFKPLLPFEDSTIALHIVTMLKQLKLDPVLVVTGYQGEELEKHLFHTGVRFLKNERYEETELFDSVCMGIEAIWQECDRILLLSVDVPAVLPDTFRKVLMVDADMVQTTCGGKRGHLVMVRSSIAHELCGYTGPGGFREAAEASGHVITSLEVDDWGVTWDVNTKEDYEALIQKNFSRGEGYPVHPRVQVQLAAKETFFGPGTAQLLEMIDKTGSIQVACQEMGLSYSKGSHRIKMVEKELGFPVVQRRAGGVGGGGSVLTEEGRRLVSCYNELVQKVRESTQELYKSCFARGLRE
ncbi:MAG: NTP transferase domain-containing protein [Lachnospiraceae bacterium]|nr:NTP transferase domain-containing protein [Lachnospiraceae bacterium]